ncbi:MAG TPA: hypothetical protein VN648_05730, partial [Candidatus Methylomirabilis sp.]|nr:hypothetical protein [Candidatus Methylomirabilis sp.]
PVCRYGRGFEAEYWSLTATPVKEETGLSPWVWERPDSPRPPSWRDRIVGSRTFFVASGTPEGTPRRTIPTGARIVNGDGKT